MDFIPMYTISYKTAVFSSLRDLPEDMRRVIWDMVQEPTQTWPQAPQMVSKKTMSQWRKMKLQALKKKGRRVGAVKNLGL